MSLGLPEEKRKKAEALVRDIAETARAALRDEGDEDFFDQSREFASGIARGILVLGYDRDYDELMALVDEVFSR